MRIVQSHWQNNAGLLFHTQAWEPDLRPRAVVALVHGLGEHVARYAPISEALVKAGFAVTGFDLRGHGRSGGPRGHTPDYEALMDDIDALLARARDRFPRHPVFLYGHSLGGGIVLNYAMRRAPTLKGVIASSPWLCAAMKPSPLRAMLARILDPVLPAFAQKWGLESASLSHDAEVVGAFDRDPLAHGLISVRMYRVCAQAGNWALEHAGEFPLPLLLMHGTADRITSWEASQEFARRLGRKCTFRLWDGWYHELHNEPGRARVVETMVSWMSRIMARSGISQARAGQKRQGMRKSRPIPRGRA